MDIVLMLFDCIPVFWLLRIVPTSSEEHQEVRKLWKNEKSIRQSFYSFLSCLLTSVALIGVLLLTNR